MSDPSPQNLKNHGRTDPSYHYFLFGILVLNLVYACAHLYRQHTISAGWFLILSIAVFVLFFKVRLYPMKVQDRVIRLEERLRLEALAPVEWRAQISKLSEDQLIGLRFASDEEVVKLAQQALEHNLTRKQIKERINNWRPDTFRV
jgi:cellulose synthase/poly-beta-1,6-N-acetylglucosamine synthase-like glycosyltransferase